MNIENESNNTNQDTLTNLPTAWNEANLINSALDDRDITTQQANEIIYEQLLPEILHTKMFIELPPERLKDMGYKHEGEALRDLLDEEDDKGNTVLDILARNRVSLSIAMQEGFDKDPLMVESLKKLNDKDIKPTLWLVLDDTLGYWSNKANVKETVEKLERMIIWSKQNSIEIDKIGLDYEPPIELLKGLMNINIPSTIKELYKYIEQSIKNRKKLGNLQQYIDSNLEQIMGKYDVGIETYATMEPLRSISHWLTLHPNENSSVVTMAYTSAFKHKNKVKNESRSSKVLKRVSEDEIPALGIVGSDPSRTPGRDLRGDKPEQHLTLEQLTYNFKEILRRNNWKSPFRTHNVFALDSAKTLEMVLKARKDATNE